MFCIWRGTLNKINTLCISAEEKFKNGVQNDKKSNDEKTNYCTLKQTV